MLHPVGRRKLRFDLRKNYERKRWPTQPRLSADAPATTSSSELVVQVQLSAYTSSMLPDASALCQRLTQSGKIPLNWMQLNTDHNPDGCLILYKVHYTPHNQSSFNLTLTIDSQCFWKMKLDSTELLSALHSVGERLDSVDAVVMLLSALNECKFCIGNDDSKFIISSDRRKGTFKDQSGMH